MMGPPWEAKSFSSFIIFTIISANFFMWCCRQDEGDQHETSNISLIIHRNLAKNSIIHLKRLIVRSKSYVPDLLQPERKSSENRQTNDRKMHTRMSEPRKGRWRRRRGRRMGKELAPEVPLGLDEGADAQSRIQFLLVHQLDELHEVTPS